MRAGDVARTRQLLAVEHVKARVNDPLFDFGGRATDAAAKNEPVLTALIDAGADLGLFASLPREVHGHLAQAIFHEHADAADLMLRLGFDPAAGGVDGGSAWHAAYWVANVPMVGRLLALGGIGLDARDPTHQSTARRRSVSGN